MALALAWVLLAIVVGVAAQTRGRDGAGWFLIGMILSPLVGGLLLLALPRIARDAGESDPHGVLDGVPYWLERNGGVIAAMQGRMIGFSDADRFVAAVSASAAETDAAVRTIAAHQAAAARLRRRARMLVLVALLAVAMALWWFAN